MAGLGLVSPGIKVREVDLTRGGITGVSYQTGAIAGPFTKGPINEPVLIEDEKDLVDTFGEPQETSSQYEYWMSASSYLSYGGVLRVVRTDGTNLVNANAAVATGSGSSVASLKIKTVEDYYNSYSSATTWYWAAKDPGTWANDLKVCVIDARADQTLSGITTAGIVVGAAVTQAFGGVQVGGIGTSLTLNGHLKGIVTGIGSSAIDVKVVSQVSTAGAVSNADYTKGGAFEFKTTRVLNIVCATGAATTSITVTRDVGGSNAGAIGVSSSVLLYNTVSADILIDNAGTQPLSIGATGVNLSDTTGISTIGDGTNNILFIDGELIGVGATIIAGTNFVGFSTRGIDGTSAASHNDGSLVTVLTNAGAATTVRVNQTSSTDTNLEVNSLNGIDINDYVRVSNETMKVVGITTNSALTPTGAADWYENQTLGLNNGTVYWKNVASKPQTSAYASSRNSRFDEIHVVVVDDSGKETGNTGKILEKWVGLSKAKDAELFNSPIYYKLPVIVWTNTTATCLNKHGSDY